MDFNLLSTATSSSSPALQFKISAFIHMQSLSHHLIGTWQRRLSLDKDLTSVSQCLGYLKRNVPSEDAPGLGDGRRHSLVFYVMHKTHLWIIKRLNTTPSHTVPRLTLRLCTAELTERRRTRPKCSLVFWPCGLDHLSRTLNVKLFL